MFGKLGSMEIIVILVIVLLIFGPTQLPKLSKMMGKSIKGFKEGLEETKESNDSDNTNA